MARLLLILTLVGCGDTDGSAGHDSAGDDDTVTGTLCDQYPDVTWDNFAQAFFEQSCQPCHASTSPNRQGAPEEIDFDTQEDVEVLAFAILQSATGPNASMPPGGGVSEEDREKLQAYLTCP